MSDQPASGQILQSSKEAILRSDSVLIFFNEQMPGHIQTLLTDALTVQAEGEKLSVQLIKGLDSGGVCDAVFRASKEEMVSLAIIYLADLSAHQLWVEKLGQFTSNAELKNQSCFLFFLSNALAQSADRLLSRGAKDVFVSTQEIREVLARVRKRVIDQTKVLTQKLSALRQNQSVGTLPEANKALLASQVKIIPKASFRILSDYWLLQKGGVEFKGDCWVIKLVGPSLAWGRWVELTQTEIVELLPNDRKYERVWRWNLKQKNQEEGSWFFSGSRTPEPFEQKWWFQAANPWLGFIQMSRNLGTKFETDLGIPKDDTSKTLWVSLDSEQARTWLPLIEESWNLDALKNLSTKPGLQADFNHWVKGGQKIQKTEPLKTSKDPWMIIAEKTENASSTGKKKVVAVGPPPDQGEWISRGEKRWAFEVRPEKLGTVTWNKGSDEKTWAYQGEKPKFSKNVWEFEGDNPKLSLFDSTNKEEVKFEFNSDGVFNFAGQPDDGGEFLDSIQNSLFDWLGTDTELGEQTAVKATNYLTYVESTLAGTQGESKAVSVVEMRLLSSEWNADGMINPKAHALAWLSFRLGGRRLEIWRADKTAANSQKLPPVRFTFELSHDNELGQLASVFERVAQKISEKLPEKLPEKLAHSPAETPLFVTDNAVGFWIVPLLDDRYLAMLSFDEKAESQWVASLRQQIV